jgi:hypothetical protein
MCIIENKDGKEGLEEWLKESKWCQEKVMSGKPRKEMISKRTVWSTVSCKRNFKDHPLELSTVIYQRSIWSSLWEQKPD